MCICFVSAVVFQFDDVHETHCRVSFSLKNSFDVFHLNFNQFVSNRTFCYLQVFNFIPSISGKFLTDILEN